METIRKKMEGLKTRLAQAEVEAKAAEDELNETNRKADETEERIKKILAAIDTLEDELDETESKMNTNESHLHLAEKKLDEVQRAKNVLAARGETEAEKKERLINELSLLQEQNKDFELKLEELNAGIEEVENTLDDEEERVSNADQKVKNLEIEVIQVGNNLRTMEISEDKANQRDGDNSVKITEISEKLKYKLEKAEAFEEQMAELDKTQDDLERKLAEEKENYNKTKRDLDITLAEIQEMNI